LCLIGCEGGETDFQMYNLVGSAGARFRLTQTGNLTIGGTIGSGAITSTAGISGTTGTFSGVVTSNGNHIAVNGANPGLTATTTKPGFAPFTAM
jgi:hypothetical protein